MEGGNGHSSATLDLPEKRKLRPVSPQQSMEKRMSKLEVSTKVRDMDRRACRSVNESGSDGLSFPMPNSLEQKVVW